MANVKGPATVGDCVMTLRTLGPTDTASWNAIWSAATFTSAMCARQGIGGVYSLIGEWTPSLGESLRGKAVMPWLMYQQARKTISILKHMDLVRRRMLM